jgi:Calcineurin-like phosphoesterase
MSISLTGTDFDIIGDIHGHADELERLLQKLGYKRNFGVYSHPQKRKAVFVGDFIDRGPKIRETLQMVRAMIESGNALAVMGNHEFNAISYHTPNTEKGGFFREHNHKEKEQHKETLNQFKNYDSEWADFLEWFKTLPLFLAFDQFRVVHACWDDKHINFFKTNGQEITTDFLHKGNDKKDKSGLFHAADETLKGKECLLPDGFSFIDKDGQERYESRIKWWSDPSKRKTMNDVFMACPEELANKKIPEGETYYSYKDPKPVFFGHYWLNCTPEIENKSAVCLDYSVARGGVLVACKLSEGKGDLEKELVM